MLQSIGKGPARGTQPEARPATQAFVTEAHGPKVQIAVGDPAQRYAKRSQEATLLGLAPPPIEYAPVAIHVQAPTREPERVYVQRDDRTLAAILVIGTLIAMFAIAFSAVPENNERGEVVRTSQPQTQVSTREPSEPSKPMVSAAEPSAAPAVTEPAIERKAAPGPTRKPVLGKPEKVQQSRTKTTSKVDSKRRVKLARD